MSNELWLRNDKNFSCDLKVVFSIFKEIKFNKKKIFYFFMLLILFIINFQNFRIFNKIIKKWIKTKNDFQIRPFQFQCFLFYHVLYHKIKEIYSLRSKKEQAKVRKPFWLRYLFHSVEIQRIHLLYSHIC